MQGPSATLPRANRVMISTIPPDSGGVPRNVQFVVETLRRRGYEPVLAYYEPYSLSPHLSVPSFRLLQRRAGSESRSAFGGCETHAIGAWLPELEFTHYLATATWKRVMDSCGSYIAVAGNALASLPYYQSGRPFLGWISSGWHEDRKDRVRQFSVARTLVDRSIVGPVARRLERSLLRSGSVLAASDYTRRLLDDIAGMPVVKDVLSTPIDTDFFCPAPDLKVQGRVGFSGRVSDPRKNVELLFAAVRHLRQAGHAVNALLIGDESGPRLRQRVRDLGIGEAVEFCAHVPIEILRDKLRSLDLFVVPSHQEGLCIAALEAMACGCPVVSTRCGGPEEFVLDDETGFLVGCEPAEMADGILRILSAPKLRERLGGAARDKVARDYSLAKANRVFWPAFEQQFATLGLSV